LVKRIQLSHPNAKTVGLANTAFWPGLWSTAFFSMQVLLSCLGIGCSFRKDIIVFTELGKFATQLTFYPKQHVCFYF